MQNIMNNKELMNLLIRLVSRTTPHGYERRLERYLPQGGKWDEADNYIVKIGDTSETLFCAHLDTVGMRRVKTKPLIEHGVIYTTRKGSCLGGDDKCGVLCLIAMIKAEIPGTYIFHAGEESGGVGATHITLTVDLSCFKRAIEFDRRGKTSVITHMGWKQTCSNIFADTLVEELGMGFKSDPTGSFTDVLGYVDVIPEVTNISVGYEHAHTSHELIDAGWLIEKLIPKLYSINWESLPVDRDPKPFYKPSWLDDIVQWYADTDECFNGLDFYNTQHEECEFCGHPFHPFDLHEIDFAGMQCRVCSNCVDHINRIYG